MSAQIMEERTTTCPLCGKPSTESELEAAQWLPWGGAALLESMYPGWSVADGACLRCVRDAFLNVLLAQAELEQHRKIQAAWPLDAQATYGVLPTYLRLHGDRRYTGRGLTLAMVDAAFYPHADLTTPRNRIRAWVDATREEIVACLFSPEDKPEWPGWSDGNPSQWHGLMTSAVAAGNGSLSGGLYRGLASEAELVLVQVMDAEGRIGNANIERALRWLVEHGTELGVRVVNLSVAGEAVEWAAGNPVDEAVQALVERGITVVAASGNAGERRLVPPATAPQALTVGGLDDKNNFLPHEIEVWHSNYGESVSGMIKPEVVAPSIWVVAPVLPHTEVAERAHALFSQRVMPDVELEREIAELKLVTPHYQHVEGTSFAAPLVSSLITTMLEINPLLTPGQVRDLLISTAQPVVGAGPDRQGAGALVPCAAVALAKRAPGGPLKGHPVSPQVGPEGISFYIYDPSAHAVFVKGSWDGWSEPGLAAEPVGECIWQASMPSLPPGRYYYHFVLEGGAQGIMDDPDNPAKAPGRSTGSARITDFESVLEIA